MKRVVVGEPNDRALAFPDPAWLDGFPHVVEYLSATQFDDGTARVASTLTLFVEGGLCKVALNDKNAGASLYRSGRSFLDAVSEVEAALEHGDGADWRPWRKSRK